MVDITIGARVECRDGRGGTCTAVVVHPQTRTVASVVVKDRNEWPSTERVVPVDRIVKTTPDTITLDCTQADLREMNPFVETYYAPHGEFPERSTYLPAMYSDDEIAGYMVETELLQPGEAAIHRGAEVEATDGKIGTVEELLISPSTGAITHVVVSHRRRLRLNRPSRCRRCLGRCHLGSRWGDCSGSCPSFRPLCCWPDRPSPDTQSTSAPGAPNC